MVRMQVVGVNREAQVEGEDRLAETRNYVIGRDKRRWQRHLATYRRVRARNVLPGVDLVYYGNQERLEYDVVVAPGSDPRQVRLAFEGVERLRVNQEGELVLEVPGGELRQPRPRVYQATGGGPEVLAGRYVVTGHHEVGFEVSAYDPKRPLVIDPVLSYATYLGGSDSEHGYHLAVDAAGNAYLTGTTRSLAFPTKNPVQGVSGGSWDVFVSRLNPAGNALVSSTYLGGSGTDMAHGLAVDATGQVVVAGLTRSTDFPTVNPVQAALGGGYDGFVARLSADGSTVNYATYLGGSGTDVINAVCLDSAGNLYLTGSTDSSDFPTANPVQPALGGVQDAFVVKLNPAAASGPMSYATYLGGAGLDVGYGIAVDAAGQAVVTGSTLSSNFPVVNAAQATFKGGGSFYGDAFVTQLNATGTALTASTYWGGSQEDVGFGIVVDAAGNTYVTGVTRSGDFPIRNALQPALQGVSDAFVVKFRLSNPAAGQVIYASYLGGSGREEGHNLALINGGVVVAGETDSTDFPTSPRLGPGGLRDVLVARVTETAGGTQPVLAEALAVGGRNQDVGESITVDGAGAIYLCGTTASTDFPTAAAVQAANAGGSDAFVFKLSACAPMALTPATLNSGRVGTAYSQPLTASGGTAPYSFSVTTGTLPAGLTLSSAGVISGTPTTAGTVSFTITATDASQCSGTQNYSLTMLPACAPMALTPATLNPGRVGNGFSQPLTASGGTAPYSFSVTTGTLPAGLTLSSAGVISGTPATAGTVSFTVTATDASQCSGTQNYSLTILPACGTITLTPATLTGGLVGVVSSQTLTASGGTAPYSFSVTTGTLPAGLTLSSAGVISGTPTTAGTSGFTVRATDAQGCTGSQSYTLVVCGTLTVSPVTLPRPVVGLPYSLTLTASGGTAPYSFGLNGGSLPVGLTLSPGGVLSGTASAVGTTSFTVRVSDATGCSSSQALTLTVLATCPSATLPARLVSGVVGLAYSQTITVSGGDAPSTYTLLSGSLPVGLSLSPSGVVSGTPASVGQAAFTVKATAANSCSVTQNYTLTIAASCPTLILTQNLPGAVVQIPYQTQLTASGGEAPYTFSLVAGTLPPGLTLTPGGLISGTPVSAGPFSVTIQATAANGCSGTQSYTLAVPATCSPVTVTPSLLFGATVGLPYSQTFTASGGTAPYTFVVSAGTLPDGLTLSADGVLSGTPTSPAAWNFTLTATSVSGCPGNLVVSGFRVGDGTVRHAPSLNGRIEGSLRLLTGEETTLNGGAVITKDLLVPGTPTLRLNGNPVFGGVIQGPGNVQPSTYQVTLNGTATLGHLINRMDPVTLPTVAPPPAPLGTRDVVITAPGGSLGDPATLRNLTLNGNVGLVAVPPGTYGSLTANGGSGFILGVAGAAGPAVYNLQNLTLNGNSQVQIVGPVILTLGTGLTLNSSMGQAANPLWLLVQVASGGVTLNGGSSLFGSLLAPTGSIILNGNSTLTGSVGCDRLTINGGGVWHSVSP